MDNNIPDFGNEDSRLFHEKVLRHDIQQVEEEIENIRWKQRDLQAKYKHYLRRYVIPLILLAVLLMIAILDFHQRLDVYLKLGKWETTLHIRRWIFLVCSPLIVYFAVVCYGVFAKEGTIVQDRIAVVFALRNYRTQERQYEFELKEKKTVLSALKQEMWELQKSEEPEE